MSEEKRDVFVSYHTSSAAQTVKKVVPALEAAGISCWYAPRDCGEEFAGSIVAAIRRCRVFLLLLNEQSGASAHVLNEINCAFERFKNHEDITLLPFRLDTAALSDDVYYYLGRIHMMDATLPPEELRIRELVDRITALLGRAPVKAAPARSGSGSGFALTGTLVFPDNHFVGREAELAAIASGLSGVENVLFLVGMGGIGKSEIAKMYVKRRAEDYDAVLWVPFDGSIQRTIASDGAFPIRGLSRADYPGDDERAYFERKLRALRETADRRVLIVMDNFDVAEDPDLEAFCGGAYSVLFTTRYHRLSGNLPEVEVFPMTDQTELMALFRAEYTRALDAAGEAAVEEILRLLDGHTLTIRLVASAMQSRRIAPEKMLSLLREGHEALEKQNTKAADMVFGRLRQVFSISTLTEEELHLLENLALIPLGGIGVEKLFDWCGLDDYDLIDGLIRRSWVIHDPVTDYVHLHPLLCDLMLEEVRRDPDCCRCLIDSMYRESEVTGRSLKDRLEMRDCAYAIYERLPADHPDRLKVLRIRASGAMSMSLYSECIPMFLELWEKGDTLAMRLYGCVLAAQAMALSGDFARAYETAKDGWALVKDIPDDALSMEEGYRRDHLLKRMIESTRGLGDYDASVEWGRKAVALAGHFYGTTPQENRGWALYHLARSLYMRSGPGDLEESGQRFHEALEQFEEIHDEWAKSYSNDFLGQVEMKRGNFDRALDLNRQAWEILLPLLGENHSDMGNSLEWRGDIYTAMGDRESAVGCYRRAEEIFRHCGSEKRVEMVKKKIG